MIFTLTQYSVETMLSSLIAADAPFDPAGLFIGLYETGPDPTPPFDLTAFTFPSLAAFAQKTFTAWSAPDYQPDGSIQVTSSVLDFSFTTFTAATNFQGIYIAKEAGADTQVRAWGVFDELVQFLVSGAHAKFVLRLTMFLDSTYRLDVIRVDG